MLGLLSYVAVYGLGVLALGSNVLYATQLGTDEYNRALWVAVAVCSAVWTACGIKVASKRRLEGAHGRAAGAFVLLGLALTFDGLAAYDLSRRELAQASEAARQDANTRADIERTMRDARAILDQPAPSLIEARAALTAVKVADSDCGLKAAKAHLDRVRDACEALARARLGLAAAEAKADAAGRLEAARERLKALGPVSIGSSRTSLIPPAIAALLPAALVLLGALVGPWSVEAATQSSPPPKKPEPAPSPAAKTAVTLLTSAAREPAAAAHSGVVVALRSITQSPPAGDVEVDNAGWIRASQRALAGIAGMSVSAFNKALRTAADRGEVQIDTSGTKTAVRVAG